MGLPRPLKRFVLQIANGLLLDPAGLLPLLQPPFIVLKLLLRASSIITSSSRSGVGPEFASALHPVVVGDHRVGVELLRVILQRLYGLQQSNALLPRQSRHVHASRLLHLPQVVRLNSHFHHSVSGGSLERGNPVHSARPAEGLGSGCGSPPVHSIQQTANLLLNLVAVLQLRDSGQAPLLSQMAMIWRLKRIGNPGGIWLVDHSRIFEHSTLHTVPRCAGTETVANSTHGAPTNGQTGPGDVPRVTRAKTSAESISATNDLLGRTGNQTVVGPHSWPCRRLSSLSQADTAWSIFIPQPAPHFIGLSKR
mmetsp:Transcript_46668/g.101429  ORF Transcript_46668/g.101429 Transcript_46668/m.101429 type:complete len:309 (+) Transcript_46668:1185-2111(+)